MNTSNFSVIPLPTAVAEKARQTAASGAPDHKISRVETDGKTPCRHCLTWAKPGERVVLFPYRSIAADRPYSETGPIFVHAEPCLRYAAPNEFPRDLRHGRVLRAYNDTDEIIAARLADGAIEETAADLFADARVRFLHVRSATNGCYTFKVERA